MFSFLGNKRTKISDGGLSGGASGRNPPANTGDVRHAGLIPGSRRSPGGGYGNPLQYSCLENSMDKRSLAGYNPWGCKESDMIAFMHYVHYLERYSEFSCIMYY